MQRKNADGNRKRNWTASELSREMSGELQSEVADNKPGFDLCFRYMR